MTAAPEPQALELWSPLPPLASGVADYVHEQLDVLGREFRLTLVAQDALVIDPRLRARYRVISAAEADPAVLRLYHVGNSPVHGYVYREANRVPGIVVLHEWNLHELLLGFAVTANDFDDYRWQMRREHGERGSVAAETIASALGGRYWSALFPLNAEILEHALALVCLSASTAARAAMRVPATPLLHLKHHAVLVAHAANRKEARARFGFEENARIVLAPGLGTASKAVDVARAAVRNVRSSFDNAQLVTVGGGSDEGTGDSLERSLGRVDLETLGDALLAADIVLALRFPSRGEASGVVMRCLAAGRALVVSTGSTADDDLPKGVVARVSPGPAEASELTALLTFLFTHEDARLRLERLSREVAKECEAGPLTLKLADFVRVVATKRSSLEAKHRAAAARRDEVRTRFRVEIEAAAAGLQMFHLPPDVFERLAGL